MHSNTSSSTSPAINLNLSSAVATSTSIKGLNSPVSIKVGGHSLSVNQGQALTPSERLAVYQVLNSGKQSIVLAANGTANGGSFSISNTFANHISSLTIPRGVSVLDQASMLSLSGNLSNFGKLEINSVPTSISFISAQNIFNNAGATIGSSNSLTLSALNNINNAGTIQSASALNLITGGSITNALPSGARGAGPLIQSAGNLTLSVGSGILSNSGNIQSTAGNINLLSRQPAAGLNVVATGGTFDAASGSINVRDASYSGSASTNLIGGNFLSQNLNLNGGTGTVNVNVGDLSGKVNTYAGSAHIGAATPDLRMGTFEVSGDPFVWNNGGNLDLFGVISGGPLPYLVATASGSIFTSGSAGISTTANVGSAGNIVLAAGVIAQDASLIGPASGNSANGTGSITLSRSGTGGDIYLISGGTINGAATKDITALEASISPTNMTSGHGGNITLIALAASAGSNQGGHIFLPGNVVISTLGVGVDGNITLIGEAASGSAKNTISLGSIGSVTDSFGSSGGNVNIQVATPNLSGVSVSDSTGSINGSFDTGSLTLQNGGISIASDASGYSMVTGGAPFGVIDGSVGSVVIKTGGTVNVTGIITSSGAGGAGASSSGTFLGLPGAPGGDAGNITIFAGGSIITASLLAFGGGGGGGGAASSPGIGLPSSGGTGGTGGAGGSIAISSNGGSVTINGDLNSSGGGAGGGGTGFGPNGLPGGPADGGPPGSELSVSAAGAVIVQGTVLSASGGPGGAIIVPGSNLGGGGAVRRTGCWQSHALRYLRRWWRTRRIWTSHSTVVASSDPHATYDTPHVGQRRASSGRSWITSRGGNSS